jgi:hypothetical protein
MLLLPLTKVASARGEGQSIADTTATWAVAPSFEGGVKGDVTKVSLDEAIKNTFAYRNGAKLMSSLSISKSKYRLQAREDNTKTWSNSFLATLKPGLLWNTTFSDSRIFNRIIPLSGGLQDFIVNTKTGSSSFQLMRYTPGGMKLDARSIVSVSSSEKIYKVDKRLQGEAGGGIAYSLGDRVRFTGRAYLMNAKDRSESGDQQFSGLGERSDSLSTKVSMKLPGKADLVVSYQRRTNTLEYIDLPRGIYFQQKLDEKDIIRETKVSNDNLLSIDATTHPLDRITLQLTADHSVSLEDYAVAKKRFSRIVNNGISGDLTYNYSSNISNKFIFKAERKDMLRDLGPLSVSSYKQKQKSVSATLNHSFTPKFSLNAMVGTTLSQIFYVDFDVNPRDRDQLNQFVQVRIASSPFPKVDAGIYLAVSSVDYINIDRSLSADNRRETTYDFRPEFTYNLNDRITISQKYGLNIEFTDFVFTENENFLDRNITFSNTVDAKLTRALFVQMHYGLLLHDRGSYLLDPGAIERVLRISQKDTKNLLRVKMRYRINEHLRAVAKQEFAERRDRVVTSGTETTFPEGTIEAGLEGEYKWSDARKLTFSLIKVNKFGRFNTKAQNDYWLMTSNLSYAF